MVRHRNNLPQPVVVYLHGKHSPADSADIPFLPTDPARYRLRLLNASNARRYRLELDPQPPGAALVQIGSDGGLLAHPIAHDSVDIAPAEAWEAELTEDDH